MIVERKKFITRGYIQANPNKAFLFGDNLLKAGYGGQARHMRGEHNSFGIPTKYYPSMNEGCFFTDDDFEVVKAFIDVEFLKLINYEVVVIPEDGLGTGLSQLDKRAPKIFAYINNRITGLEEDIIFAERF